MRKTRRAQRKQIKPNSGISDSKTTSVLAIENDRLEMEQEIKSGEELFAKGRVEEAETVFLNLLKKEHENAEIFNNLGVICHGLGRNQDAEAYLSRALEVESGHGDASANLVALRKNSDFSNNLNVSSPSGASILDPVSSPGLTPMKVLLCCLPGLDNFVDDLICALKPDIEITKLVSNRLDDFLKELPDYDVVWLEWGNQLAEALTRLASGLLKKKKVICRIHSYEVLDGLADRLDFSVVDDLIFVAPHIRDILIRRQPNILRKVAHVHVIPNGVDLNRFTFSDRPRGFNLAYLGSINYKKGPMLLLHAFWNLVQEDNRYHLFIGGNYQDLRYQLYFDEIIKSLGLTRNVSMDGWVRDVSTWLEDKHFIICSSLLEGHPLGVLEGMARGLKPAIHTFVGARQLYPESYLWKSIPEFADMIASDHYYPGEYRKYVEQNCSLKIQLDSFEKILSGTMNEKTYYDSNRLNFNVFGQPPFRKRGVPLAGSKSVTTEDSIEFYNNFLENLKHDHLRANPRHEQARQSLKKILRPGMKILDIGCGTGITSHFMAELGAYVTAIDLSDRLISYANEKSAHPNIRYLVQDATRLSLGEVFDVITIIDSLEHIIPKDLDNFFQVIRLHSSEETMIYLNIPDGRFQSFIRRHHPEKLQIIDEGYNPEKIIFRFKSIGFEVLGITIYGIDAPVQYNEYVLARKTALDQMYFRALHKS